MRASSVPPIVYCFTRNVYAGLTGRQLSTKAISITAWWLSSAPFKPLFLN